MERKLRKVRVGVVVSNKMDKSAVVAVKTKGLCLGGVFPEGP